MVFAVARFALQRIPDGNMVGAALSFPLALIGAALLVFSVFMGLSILVTPAEDFHRRENLRNCGRTLAAGVVLVLPFLYFIVAFKLNPPF